MLTMGLILAFMSVGLEMFVVTQYESLRSFMIKHEKFGLFFSFFLSFFIGECFGAHGVIALFAGITSTVMTIVIYKAHLLHFVDTYRENKEVISAKFTSFVQVTKGAIIFWWKIFTAPYKAYVAVKARCRKISNSVRAAKAWLKGVFHHDVITT